MMKLITIQLIYINKIKNITYTLIPENYFINIEIKPDGDCFFNALVNFYQIIKIKIYI